jgi:hypothetical protein
VPALRVAGLLSSSSALSRRAGALRQPHISHNRRHIETTVINTNHLRRCLSSSPSSSAPPLERSNSSSEPLVENAADEGQACLHERPEPKIHL